MEKINKLEQVVAGWYNNLPHLPKGGQEWLAKHAWWIVLVAAILEALGILVAGAVSILAGLFLVSFGGIAGLLSAGFLAIFVMVVLALSVIMVVLSFMAIRPLQELRKRGWSLVFIVFLIEVAAQVANFIVGFWLSTSSHLTDLLGSLLILAVGGYFLFEIRHYFGAPKTAKKPDADKK